MDKCPNCGNKVLSSDKRCSKCGQELKKSSNGSVVAILLIVILIAIVGVLAVGNQSNYNTADVAVANDVDSSVDSVEETTATDSSAEETTSNDNSYVQDGSSSSGTVYWASDESDKFHKPSCEWAQKIAGYNKIVYHSRQEALNDGKVPCHVCYP